MSGFVLKGIESMLQCEVKFFSLVRQDGQRLYLCLGKRECFLLDFDPPFQEQYFYARIKQVILDSEDLLLFQIDFNEGHQSILLESFERERLCDELAVAWKADYMYRNWQWRTFPLKKGKCNASKLVKHSAAAEFVVPPPKMRRAEGGGYFMFIDEMYREDTAGAKGMPSGRFRLAGREREFRLVVEPKQPVAQLGRREKDELRLAAERLARAHTADSEMIVLRSELYHKRMNLTGDLSHWSCWAVHLRTPLLDVGVIATRRKYLPAMGDTYQDIFVVQANLTHLFSPHVTHTEFPHVPPTPLFSQTDEVLSGDPREYMQGLEKVVDTLSPRVRVPYYDDIVTRLKADALLYDEDSFSWFHSMGITSSNVDAACAFYKSVANLLNNEGIVEYDMAHVEPETVLIQDPFRVIIALWEDAPGLSPKSSPLAWRNWRRRVARYLFWAIDGGFCPGEMSFELLVRCERRDTCSVSTRDIMQRLFDFFVHVSTESETYQLDVVSLADRVADEDFMRIATMNRRPLVVLIESGYMRRLLESESPPKYVPFLAEMLKRPFPNSGPELLTAVCHQVAMYSTASDFRDAMLEAGVLLPLIEALRSENDVLLLAVVKALINLSSKKAEAKDMIVSNGGARAIIPHLLTKGEELTRSFCVLLKNCLTMVEVRERIHSDGAVAPLTKLLHRTAIVGTHRSDAVVAAAAAAVWNVSALEEAKKIVLKERGVEALVLQLRESQSEDVWQKCAGCLMVLAANRDDIKRLVGEEMGVHALTHIVIRRAGPGENTAAWNVPVLKAALGALAVLSSDDRNLMSMQTEGMEQAIEKYGQLKDDRVQAFVAQLTERLYQEKRDRTLALL